MNIFYDIFIILYTLALKIAAIFNKKAAMRVKGLKKQQKIIDNFKHNNKKCILMHCASLGEYEQGRPLLQKFKDEHPEMLRVLTFFSPSGYEKRKNTPEADYVFYLPPDTKKQARKFINTIKPDLAVFVKYEFWFRHLEAVKKQGGKNILIAGIFREKQHFFRPVKKIMPKILDQFNFFLLQNKESVEILNKAGYKNTVLAGDPRFDRVITIAAKSEAIHKIETFKKNSLLIIAGSTWSEDEKLLSEYIKTKTDIKIVIAPHEIHSDRINYVSKLFQDKVILFSQDKIQNSDAQCMIIDNIGMLSKIYRYADICYIGGGFGAGIHNTLEAAVYRKPVIFGPKYKKFSEACELVSRKAAFAIKNYTELKQISDRLLTNSNDRLKAGNKAKLYCEKMRGSTDKSYKKILEILR